MSDTEKITNPKDELTDIPGVGAAIAAKLIEKGYTDFLTIAVENPKTLSEIGGMTEEGLLQIVSERLQLQGIKP